MTFREDTNNSGPPTLEVSDVTGLSTVFTYCTRLAFFIIYNVSNVYYVKPTYEEFLTEDSGLLLTKTKKKKFIRLKRRVERKDV